MALAVSVSACSTPVFRYALERWQPSFYGVLVFHQGPLDASQQNLVNALKEGSVEGDVPANFSMLVVDIASEKRTNLVEMWKTQTNASLPWVMVRYPETGPESPSAWAGPLTAQNVLALINSPARQEIATKVGRGDAISWVIVESGDKTKDEATASLLQGLLKKLESVVEIPADPDGDPAKTAKLKLSFPIIRVSRSNPAENFFVNTLFNMDESLSTNKEPVAFPVFGRGRALAAVPAAQINEELVEAATRFLLGDCSCQIKEQNPGFDLLVRADWDAALAGERVSDEPSPALMSLASVAQGQTPPKSGSKPAPVAPVVTGKPAETAPANSTNPLFATLATLGGTALVVLGFATFLMLRGKKTA